jgi:hypothetical protein
VADIADVVQGFAGVRPMPGMDACWTWSIPNMFTYGLALTTDGAHAVQMNIRGEADEELMISVLSYAREHSAEVLAAVPFAVLEGFTPPAKSEVYFDTVAAAIPGVLTYQKKQPALTDVTYAVFPAYRCEFSGRETQQEAVDRVGKFMRVADIRRMATPFLKLRYDNPKTGGGTIGTQMGLDHVETLMRELRYLEGADGAYIDFENFRSRQRRAYWKDGLWLADGPEAEGRQFELTDLLAWTHQFIFEGTDDES